MLLFMREREGQDGRAERRREWEGGEAGRQAAIRSRGASESSQGIWSLFSLQQGTMGGFCAGEEFDKNFA